jgi:hypothetical protein
MTHCPHLVFGYSPCTRPHGHTGAHHGDLAPRNNR